MALTLNDIAKEYVQLALGIGLHHEHYIDAYFGPKEWKAEEKVPLERLFEKASTLYEMVKDIEEQEDEELRKEFLLIHLQAMKTFISQLNGEKLSFDKESYYLYDAISPALNKEDLDKTLEEINTLLPGEGELHLRMDEYNKNFVIPKDKLDDVFCAAMNESRRITKKYIHLSENESFDIEYVSNKVWSGYNWYKGDNYSVIQLNTDFPMYINRAIDLASHEGYPGHHVFNSLIEEELVKGKGWMEYSVYVLYSPLSLLAEGSANYGIELSYSKENRMKFEKEVLFPLANLNSDDAALYYLIQEKLQKLSYAGNMVAQQYLDGTISKDVAIQLLMKYSLTNIKRATQRLAFIEANRSYVINYNLGQDIVKNYVEKYAENENEATKWQIFSQLLSNPKTASMMQ